MRSTWHAERLIFLTCFAAIFFFLGMQVPQEHPVCPKVQRITQALAVRDAACLTSGQIKWLVYRTAQRPESKAYV